MGRMSNLDKKQLAELLSKNSAEVITEGVLTGLQEDDYDQQGYAYVQVGDKEEWVDLACMPVSDDVLRKIVGRKVRIITRLEILP